MKTVIGTVLGLVLAAGVGYSQDPPGEPGAKKGDASKAELDKAAATAGAMTNYSSVTTIKTEGLSGEGKDPTPIQLLIQPDSPWHLRSGEIEAFKRGEALAVKEGNMWKRLDKGAKAGHMLGKVRGPHETLKQFTSASFKEVKREASEGGQCFSGELTEEFIRQLAQGKKGGERALPNPTGTAKIWVNGEGAVTRYEVNIESKMKNADNQEVAVKRTVTVEIRDIGTTKYDVPPDAAKALEG